MIPQRNISLLSNRLAREGGCRIPEAVLERDYCLAWFLVGLSRARVREHLVFKGGTALDAGCRFDGPVNRGVEHVEGTECSKFPWEDMIVVLNPIVYTEKVVRSFLRYQLTTYPFADERLHSQMRRLLSLDETRQSPLLKGPYISLYRAPFLQDLIVTRTVRRWNEQAKGSYETSSGGMTGR